MTPNGCPNGGNVGSDLPWVCKEMEGRAVVPEVIFFIGPESRDVGGNQPHFSCTVSESDHCPIECRLGNVQNGDPLKTFFNQIVHELAVTTSYIKNVGGVGE